MRLDLIPVQYEDGTEVENPIWGLTRNKFVGLQIPPRESLLTTHGETVLYSSSINQILAWRGVGKTNFALALAGALLQAVRFSTLKRRVRYALFIWTVNYPTHSYRNVPEC